MSKLKRKTMWLFLILIAILSLISCQINVVSPTEVKGEVSFNFDLGGAKAAGYNITRVHIKLTHQSAGIVKEQDLTVDASNNKAYGRISGLRIGTWDVLAELYENDTVVGSGTSQVTIEPRKTADVHIRITLETGSANIVVVWGESEAEVNKLELPFVVEGLEIGDWDNDGIDEIFIGTKNKELLISKFDPIELGLTIEASVSFPEVPLSIVYNDVDNDGKKEFIVGTSGDPCGYVYIGTIDSSGWHQEWKSGCIGSIRVSTEISVGDENGDGKKEIAVGISFYGRKLVVYGYNGSTYNEKWTDNIGSDTDSTYYYDLDNDNKDELIVGTSHWSDWAFRIYDEGSLVKKVGGDKSRNLVCGANLKNLGNVAVRGKGIHSTGSGKIGIEVYKKTDNDYSMIAEYKKDVPDGANMSVAPAASDLDGDGYDEIVYFFSYYPPDAHPNNSELGILKYDGDNLKLIKSYELNLNHVGLNIVKMGDVDGDGKLEIIVPSYFDQTNTPTPILNIINPLLND